MTGVQLLRLVMYPRLLLLLLALLVTYATPAQTAPAAGHVERHADFPSKLVKPRNIEVWLPAGYPESGKRYPVLYMHDGQNLFSPTTAYGGTAWEVDSLLSQLIQTGKARECIVVGIWNTEMRFREYAPAQPYGQLSAAQQQLFRQELPAVPLSDAYLKFLVTELKPFIDKQYHTAPKRADTFVAGSSMGGLISVYAALEYPQVFGGAACLSTHWPLGLQQNRPDFTEAMVAYLQQKLPRRKRPKLYFDYGTATLDAWYEPHQLRIDGVLRAAGYTEKNWLTRKYEGAAHNEASWQQRVAVPLEFLLAPER